MYLHDYFKQFSFRLVWLYDISTMVGYSMPNPFYTYILSVYDLSLTIQLNISHLFTQS